MDNDVIADAHILWDYMLLHEPPFSADMLLVLGSVDERVAVRAAELSNLYDYALICFTGGIAHESDMLQTTWSETEAEHFYNVFIQSKGKGQKVLLETRAQNTGQNARYVYEQLAQSNMPIPASIQIVTKPYMERRALATFEIQWPADSSFLVTSPRLTFNEYVQGPQRLMNDTIHIMVGDLDRIEKYPAQGYQTKQKIPVDVKQSWQRLVNFGYNKHLLGK